MTTARAYTPRTSPVQAAWTTIKATGTPAQVQRGAHYLAYGRTADVIALAATIARTTTRHLSVVAA